MRRIRIMASRQAWLKYSRERNAEALAKYTRIVGYECRRNGTEQYTPYWAV